MMKKILLIPVMLLCLGTMTSCETTQGVGRDLQDAGNWITRQFE